MKTCRKIKKPSRALGVICASKFFLNMELDFIGVGEAFEPQLGNASYLLHSETKLLIDCGYAVPRDFFARNFSSDYVDALYLTHFHADHCFGIPPLIKRWNEDGRTKALTIIGQPGTKEHINHLIDMGYSKCRSKLRFDLRYLECNDENPFHELTLTFAPTAHSQKNYAIKIDKSGTSIGISGDGGLTKATRQLFHDCQVLVHEAYGYRQAPAGHTHALEIVDYAKSIHNLQFLALVHIQRDEREKRIEEFKNLQNQVSFRLLIPSPGDVITIQHGFSRFK